MTEGMAASSSTAGCTAFARVLPETSVRNTAVSKPMGTPSSTLAAVPTMEERMI